ncbi:MAG: membrane dipeptidase [Ruminococcus sp.]|nr:membrane dipeptidase [Ruminococcus sp.]
MHIIDLHCDTLYKAVTENIFLDSNQMEVSPYINKGIQCYAIWLPDEYSGEKAEQTFFKAANLLKSECKRIGVKFVGNSDNLRKTFSENKFSACFTVENSLALNNKIENVKNFADLGVRIMTLTWNGRNPVGDGAEVDNPTGITEFGKKVVTEMERYNIVVDVSHASDKLFYDVAEIARRPFIATHSNSRSVTSHKRNLTDEQFEIIKNNGGIVGLNFHNAFLSDEPDKASKYDLLKHTEKFLSLGGENTIAIGSDFDGCSLSDDIKGSISMAEIYEMFLRYNYKESLIRKIFFENALKFFENFDKERIM